MLQASYVIRRLHFAAQFLQVHTRTLPPDPSSAADSPAQPAPRLPTPPSLPCITHLFPYIYFSIQEIYGQRLEYDSTWASNEGVARRTFLFAAWPLTSCCQGIFDYI